MYRVAVCDDNRRITEEVSRLVREWNPKIQVDQFSSGEELLEAYKPYQAVFLDIDMGGIDGIETGERIRRKDKMVKLVYLTAYQDYVAGAFGVHAFQYLLKPVKKAEILHVLEEVFRYIQEPEKKVVLDFQTVKGVLVLPVDEIYYFEYQDRRVHIVTADARYVMVEKIGNVGERMKEYGFSMPHQSFVVNMLHVKNVFGGTIFLDNGMEIPLAQKKQKEWKQELVSWLSQRLEGRG